MCMQSPVVINKTNRSALSILTGGVCHGCPQGTVDRLINHLVEQHSAVDPTYVEDFLLTYRAFLKSPLLVAEKLLAWFSDPKLRDRVSSSPRFKQLMFVDLTVAIFVLCGYFI